MSAYIVQPETINRVVSFLNLKESDFRCVFRESGYDLSQYDDLGRLAGDLYLMNCDAVDCRYSHGTAAHDESGKPFPEFAIIPVSPMQAYKAAQCLRYQCSEGDVVERPLYLLLTRIYNQMAHRLVQQVEEYNTAKWG